ncbi:hypothetical protein C7974DRAFT_470384 [Boeremia exigua]|uniref:uncharacterized protein n=1 Tax=Boeremia exigua TaxID=749465 RepID=UPI001E8E2631|nr:uncharacterized protein C7974DRAFT_470384 [Boeremia exigua]KAH6637465.1 hypothetical protein C7974DRAFT_470384 [Boeremia exigua]
MSLSPQPKTGFAPSPKPNNIQDVRVVTDNSLDITGSFLEVVVGKDGNQENFFLHERLFTSHSVFLKCAAKREWIQHKNAVLLPQYDPATFRLYAAMTYSGFLATKGLPFEWQSLVDVYVLTEELQDSWAKDHIVDAMHSFAAEHLPRNPVSNGKSRFTDCISTASLCQLYENTPTSSQARKLVVDLFADNGSGEWLASAGDLLPHEFILGVAIRLMPKPACVVFGNMLDRPSSRYHEKVQGQRIPSNTRPATVRLPKKVLDDHGRLKWNAHSVTPFFNPSKSTEPTPAKSGQRTPSAATTKA